MLRRLFLTFLLLLAAPAWAVPAMWQVGQGKRQITLYGTIHALPKGTDWLTAQAARAFNRAGTLVVEIAGPPDPAAMREVVMELGRLPTPVPLASRLPDDLKPKADALLKATGLPPGALDGMESWLAALTLVQIEVARAGLDPAAGVDVALIARARAAGKPLVGLETPRGQLPCSMGCRKPISGCCWRRPSPMPARRRNRCRGWSPPGPPAMSSAS